MVVQYTSTLIGLETYSNMKYYFFVKSKLRKMRDICEGACFRLTYICSLSPSHEIQLVLEK